MEEIKEMKIQIPEGYEIDEENSTFRCIKFKPIVKTLKDIENVSGYYIDTFGKITHSKVRISPKCSPKELFLTEKHAKMALAIAQISQLMPYYGGEITMDEYRLGVKCFRIWFVENNFKVIKGEKLPYFLTFHTEEQALRFLINNRDLLRDYFMIN